MIDILHKAAPLVSDHEARRVLSKAWKFLGCDPRKRRVSLAWVSPTESRKWNKTYRGENKTTNVLSFQYGDVDGRQSSEIVLCSSVIRREANEDGIPVIDCAVKLLIHGLLHTEGYAHDTEASRKRMERLERKFLTICGYDASYIKP